MIDFNILLKGGNIVDLHLYMKLVSDATASMIVYFI